MTAKLIGFIDQLEPGRVSGWVYNTSNPGQPVSFKAVIDNDYTHFDVATIFRSDVIGSGHLSGNVGFSFGIPDQFQDGRAHSVAFFLDDDHPMTLSHPTTSAVSHQWNTPAPEVTAPALPTVLIYVDSIADGCINGWAYDENTPLQPVELQLWIDGVLVADFICDTPREDVRNSGHPSAVVGYSRTIPSKYCDNRDHRLAFTTQAGGPVRSATGDTAPSWSFAFPATAVVGRVDGLHGGAILGWALLHDHLLDRRSGGLQVLTTHLGQPIGQVCANQFRADVAERLECDPNCGFAFTPPTEIVAGRTMELRFRVLPDGLELQNSPFMAIFPELKAYRTFRDLLDVTDRLFTQMWALRAQIKSLLPADHHTIQSYDGWARLYYQSLATRKLGTPTARPLVSIICPTYRPRPKDFLAAVQSVMAQTYSNWELIIVDDCSGSAELNATIAGMAERDSRIRPVFLKQNAGISGATNIALNMTNGDYVAFFDHDDLLVDRAIEIMLHAALTTGAKLLYCDEDKIDDDGVFSEVNFKPDWNRRLLLSQNYICHLLFVERGRLRQAEPLRKICDGAQDHDLILRLADITPNREIHHVAETLYHWRKTPTSTASSGKSKSYAVQAGVHAVSDHLARLGLHGTVSSPLGVTIYEIEWAIETEPKVTIIIPYREHIDLTRACVRAIQDVTLYKNYEIVLVDNWSTSAAGLAFPDEIAGWEGVRVIRVEQPFNYSQLNNIAVGATTGDFLLFLNNDVFVKQPNWLGQMVGEALADPLAAIVGVKLLYPNTLVQHAGVILGVGGVADHAFRGLAANDPGYMARAICAQDLSAVTAACMLCRREAFDAVGGFDAAELRVAFNDVDLCLKMVQAGYRVVWTPAVVAEHRESLSRGSDFKPEHQARFFDENAIMTQRWGDILANDKHYSRRFSRQGGLFVNLSDPTQG